MEVTPPVNILAMTLKISSSNQEEDVTHMIVILPNEFLIKIGGYDSDDNAEQT
jgi:hypothetical protein